MFSLVGKSILVTGASSGIGRQIAIDVATLGAEVTLIGRDEKRLEEVMLELSGNGHSFYSFDLTDEAEMNIFISKCDSFDGVVFNAGIVEYGPIKFISSQKIDYVFDINFKAVVLLNQLLVNKKLIRKAGSLVFISSISSLMGVQATALYAASKAALSAYSRIVAAELAKQKIRSNSISPGIVITDMISQANDANVTEDMQAREKAYPLGYGEPKDVSSLVVYLLSDASRWMTGSDLKIDGGLTLT